jgi:hypothetical protein
MKAKCNINPRRNRYIKCLNAANTFERRIIQSDFAFVQPSKNDDDVNATSEVRRNLS